MPQNIPLGDLDGSGSFVPVSDEDISFACGCGTPAPTVAITPAPVPAARGPRVVPTPASVATPFTPAPVVVGGQLSSALSPTSETPAPTRLGDDGPSVGTMALYVAVAIVVAGLATFGAFKLVCQNVCLDNHVFCCSSRYG